jgi:hypothetical protein
MGRVHQTKIFIMIAQDVLPLQPQYDEKKIP